MLAAAPVGNSRFVSIFHFGAYVRKNAKGLIRAVEIASREHPDIELDIFGTGTPEDLRAMRGLLKSPVADASVHLCGPLPREMVQRQIQKYVAFVMPTRRESYGMVFAESLLAGVPILQSKGWGIQGLFADADVGYSCDSGSIEDIKEGLLHLLKNEEGLKRGIARRQQAGEFNILRRDSIAAEYRRIIATVVSSGAAIDLRPSSKTNSATRSQHV
jgi:glycosyltransferase involved in cell wall biosynthesis